MRKQTRKSFSGQNVWEMEFHHRVTSQSLYHSSLYYTRGFCYRDVGNLVRRGLLTYLTMTPGGAVRMDYHAGPVLYGRLYSVGSTILDLTIRNFFYFLRHSDMY